MAQPATADGAPGAALGLIAGGGGLPLALARAARRGGRRVTAVAFPGLTDPALEAEVAGVAWHAPGEVEAATAALTKAGAAEAVLAGALPKAALFAEPGRLALDARGRALLAALPDRSDGTLLRAVADHLEGRGIRLLPQAALAPELLAAEGPLGRQHPTPSQQADIAYGLPIARELARREVGQTLVVKDRTVLAVEAAEGTDATIRRAGALARGASVVKLARPDQDPRFDLPAVGPDTLSALRDAGAAALAVQAGATLVLEAAALREAADAAGIAIVGVRV